MRNGEGSSTVTYRLKLHYKKLDWINRTKELYNDVMLFYYLLLLENTNLLKDGNQKLMRELEKLTIVSRDKKQPDKPLPYEKVPVYFRRAAINGAIGLVRTFSTKYLAWIDDSTLEKPRAADKFNAQPLFYKGMYKEFEKGSIILKLWTGASWAWVKHEFKGRKIPDDAEILSPTLSIKKDKVMLHVPIKTKVSDIRTVKERVEDKERICSVSLSSNDTFAVCTILESDGNIRNSCFIRGGNDYKRRRKRLLGKIAQKQSQSGVNEKGSRNNVLLNKKIRNISEYYSHYVSRRIIDYCIKHGVKIIIFQNIDRIVPLNKNMNITENEFIIRRIKKYTEYKAFSKGMVVTTVRPNYTSCKCYQCRAYGKKYKSISTNHGSNKMFICENGHQSNAELNTAKNIGLMFIKKGEAMKVS